MQKKIVKNLALNTLKKPSSRFSKLFPFVIIIFLCSIFFWRVFLKNEIPFPGDFVVGIYYPWLDYKWGWVTGVPVKNPITADVPSFMYPMQTFAANLIKSGQWPLWNPHILAGAPLLANFQSAPFSPLTLFYILFPYKIGWTLQIIAAHVITAFFTFILLRHWKVSKSAAILGGIIFAFSGFNLIWSQWNGHVLTAACFPLLIYFVDRLLTKGQIRDGIGICVALALQVVAGYPQLVLYTALVIAIVVLWRFSWDKKFFLKSILVGIFLFLGFALSAVQLLPGYELLSLSQWSAEPHPREWAFLPLEKTITFLAPDYFGNHVTKNYWGKQDYTSNTGFVGVGAFALALVGVGILKKKIESKIALSITFASLILSYNTPLSELLWQKNIFGMQSSSAHRALVLFNLGIALLAGFGWDSIRKQKISLKFFGFIFFVIGGLLGIFVLHANAINNQVAIRNLLLPIAIFIIFIFVIFLIKKVSSLKPLLLSLFGIIIIFEIYRFGWKFTPFSSSDLVFPHTPVTQFLSTQNKPFRISNGDTMPVNFQMAYGLETIGGYETMRPLPSSQFISALNTNNPLADPSGRYGIIDNDTSHLLDLANTKYYLALKKNPAGAPDASGQIPKKYNTDRFKVAFEDKTTVVMESKSVLPRAMLFYDWLYESSDEKTLSTLLDPSFAFSQKVILTNQTSVSPTKLANEALSFDIYQPQYSKIKVSAKAHGIVFVSDAWYPGWEAYLDGQKVPLLKADYMFRGVMVPQGDHIVEFKYEPTSFKNGLKISGITFVILGILFLFTSFRGKNGIYLFDEK